MFDRHVEIASATDGHGFRRVQIDEEGLWITGRLVMARRDIGRVKVEWADRWEVAIYRSGHESPDSVLVFTERSACDETLVALGRSPQRVVVRASLAAGLKFGSALTANAKLSLLVVIALFSVFPAGVTAVALAAALAGAFASFGRWLEIGEDGLLLNLMWKREFVPYRRIASVESAGRAIRIRFHDGTHRRVGPFAAARIPSLVACIMQRFDSFAAPRDAATAGASEGQGAYRTASVPETSLWRIAEDPAAQEDARIRALRELADEEDPERLRVAIEGTLDPIVGCELRKSLTLRR